MSSRTKNYRAIVPGISDTVVPEIPDTAVPETPGTAVPDALDTARLGVSEPMGGTLEVMQTQTGSVQVAKCSNCHNDVVIGVEEKNVNGVEVELGVLTTTNLAKNTTATKKRGVMDMEIGIIGDGEMGSALKNKLRKCGFSVASGTRQTDNIEKVCSQSDIIILAVPFAAMQDVIKSVDRCVFTNKVVIDISNRDPKDEYAVGIHNSVSEKLSELLPYADVVKAFNTISAYCLRFLETHGGRTPVYFCGTSTRANNLVEGMISALGFEPVDRGELQAAGAIEAMPYTFYPRYDRAILVTLLVLIPTTLYAYFRYIYNGNKTVDHLAMYVLNKSLAWTALDLLAVLYFVGIVASVWSKPLPRVMIWWLEFRRELGLVLLFLGTLHLFMSLLMTSPGYYAKMYKFFDVNVSDKWEHGLEGDNILHKTDGEKVFVGAIFNAIGEWNLFFALLGYLAFFLVGISTLPSVEHVLSWKEWDFVQKKLGWAAIVFNSLHVIVYGAKGWYAEAWQVHAGMPSITLLSTVFPMFVMFCKLITMLPGIRGWVEKRRKMVPPEELKEVAFYKV